MDSGENPGNEAKRREKKDKGGGGIDSRIRPSRPKPKKNTNRGGKGTIAEGSEKGKEAAGKAGSRIGVQGPKEGGGERSAQEDRRWLK